MLGESSEGLGLGTPFLLSALEFDRGMPHSCYDIENPRKTMKVLSLLVVDEVVTGRAMSFVVD